MTFTPTDEQLACVNAATSLHENLIISALAGAAKTSTLVLIAEAVQKQMLCLAFNKKIQVEMSKRLPSHCKAMTLNGLGHSALMRFTSRRLVVDTSKNYNIVTRIIEQLTDGEKKEAYGRLSDILKAVASGKTAGYIPDEYIMEYPNSYAKPLMGNDDFFAWLDEEPSDLEERIIIEASCLSIRQGLTEGLIDFDDQILLSTVFPASFEKYPIVLIDEAQDLSALNHAMLSKLCPPRKDPTKPGLSRLIAVGDPCQSIYGFRGAHQNSMQLLQQQYSAIELHLTISFRCPIKVVEAARWRAPAMRWPDWAQPGEVRTLGEWCPQDIPDNAAVICRNNAPLFNLAIRLLKNGRYPELLGNDIGKGLVKIMNKFGPKSMPQEEVLEAITRWREEKLRKSRAKDSINDRAACMQVFAEHGADLGEAVAYAESIFSAGGSIKLMTGHKSKGLEFDDVFMLNPSLLRLEHEQERNLKYVMQTRAKQRLTYIEMEGYYE